MAKERRQVVRFLFLKLDPAWRRLPAAQQAEQKEEFGRTIKSFHAKLLMRTYSTVGTRGDCDILLWQAAENLETLQRLETAVFSTQLGGYFSVPYSYLGMTRKSTSATSGGRTARNSSASETTFPSPWLSFRTRSEIASRSPLDFSISISTVVKE